MFNKKIKKKLSPDIVNIRKTGIPWPIHGKHDPLWRVFDTDDGHWTSSRSRIQMTKSK